MFEMKVPKYMWSYAVLMAAYLVNRMPSTPLGGEIPLRWLCPNKELFNLPPKVFGCTAYVQSLGLGLDKLNPRSIKCIFVGYSRTQEGYRYYHPPTHRYLVSADVTFFESKSYFESTES